MAEGEESAEAGGASEKVEARDHFDNPLVFLVVIGLFVYGFGCAGRALGNRIQKPGITAFFGG